MKLLVTVTTVMTTLLIALASQAGAGVSISIGDPSFYGRIDIGYAPSPRLVYEQPIIVHRVKVWHPPIYLRVPPGHVQQWHRHCHQYNACGRPVYFVDDRWYREVYVPRYHEYHRQDYRRPPARVHRPEYYEYRYDPQRPGKKDYIREQYQRDNKDASRGRGPNR